MPLAVLQSLNCSTKVHLSHRFQHPQAFVSQDELDTLQSAAFQPLKEADSAGLVFLHALGSAQYLTVAILIDHNSNQYADILILAAPVSAQIDSIYIDIRILAAMQRTVAPVLNVDT